jgi:hypothetical protein
VRAKTYFLASSILLTVSNMVILPLHLSVVCMTWRQRGSVDPALFDRGKKTKAMPMKLTCLDAPECRQAFRNSMLTDLFRCTECRQGFRNYKLRSKF